MRTALITPQCNSDLYIYNKDAAGRYTWKYVSSDTTQGALISQEKSCICVVTVLNIPGREKTGRSITN